VASFAGVLKFSAHMQDLSMSVIAGDGRFENGQSRIRLEKLFGNIPPHEPAWGERAIKLEPLC
jgi:hypothetical protein